MFTICLIEQSILLSGQFGFTALCSQIKRWPLKDFTVVIIVVLQCAQVYGYQKGISVSKYCRKTVEQVSSNELSS